MTAIAVENSKNYTLARCKVLFDRFAKGAAINSTTQGEGFRYFGNTPSISVTGTSDNLDHFDADNGVKEKDDAVLIMVNRNGKMECDNVDKHNVALMFLGEAATQVQDVVASGSDEFVVKRGRWYQLGVTPTNPSGLRLVTLTDVKNGASFADTVDNATDPNFQFDTDLGLIYIEPNAVDIADGDTIKVDYSAVAATRDLIVSSSNAVYGQLKTIAANPRGENRDHLYPYVKISPDGDYNLKGDDWQKMGFTFEILKRGNLEAAYIDSRAVADA